MPVFILDQEPRFPPAQLANPEGILAIGGDLSQERLINAYSQGIFPWYSEGEPIIWWSPDPRTVLFPGQLHISRRMQRILKKDPFTIKVNCNFADVIRSCQTVDRKNETGTWITAEMIQAYNVLHQAGYAHSIEVYKSIKLVGGFYGIALGGCFFGESMFHTEPNASKYGFIKFVQQIFKERFLFIDCQISSQYLRSLGARDISREKYLSLLKKGVKRQPLKWDWTNWQI
jgi:leucyl/phenylalanyl-tRNA--protein transferase